MTLGSTRSAGVSAEGLTPPRLDYAGIAGLTALYREAGELLVYHEGAESLGFAVCAKCGHADSEPALGRDGRFSQGIEGLSESFKNHPPIDGAKKSFRCWKPGKSETVLRYRNLAARQITDVLMLDFSHCLSTHDPNHEAIVNSLALALRIAGAGLLQLDTREIGSMAIRTESEQGYGAVLYDNVPGGAGHVGELLEREREWILEARRCMHIDDRHHDRCEVACLDCLLTYDAQTLVQGDKLARRAAVESLDRLLG